ncbi:hypothetical protein SAMD00019534_123860 [Acytostelium subglobosum LB1]|uniref:hypothetical protein n=1 Tax=Acytostelium subglobosum LB1 TaxID=1410327 RepID=UPI0006450877|nr:hypothetical protein SAMD00019534_123860 [Acytostelium subglobosum LB1]GAM29210.1 hypothetical protein SAMD00019534_123860 [Acytostelium subglobosum LB1]|eukprot:XP_012747901.1 hypothetical protein SAMD00019534_123860 [Acytostelium subglobosum LB1]
MSSYFVYRVEDEINNDMESQANISNNNMQPSNTVIVGYLPTSWFVDNETADTSYPSAEVIQRVFNHFGQIDNIEILVDTPKDLVRVIGNDSNISGMVPIASLDKLLHFQAAIQFSSTHGASDCQRTLSRFKMFRNNVGYKADVRFDSNDFFSELSSRKRKLQREQTILALRHKLEAKEKRDRIERMAEERRLLEEVAERNRALEHLAKQQMIKAEEEERLQQELKLQRRVEKKAASEQRRRERGEQRAREKEEHDRLLEQELARQEQEELRQQEEMKKHEHMLMQQVMDQEQMEQEQHEQQERREREEMRERSYMAALKRKRESVEKDEEQHDEYEEQAKAPPCREVWRTEPGEDKVDDDIEVERRKVYAMAERKLALVRGWLSKAHSYLRESILQEQQRNNISMDQWLMPWQLPNKQSEFAEYLQRERELAKGYQHVASKVIPTEAYCKKWGVVITPPPPPTTSTSHTLQEQEEILKRSLLKLSSKRLSITQSIKP